MGSGGDVGGDGGRPGTVGLAEAGEVLGVGVHGVRRLVRAGDLVAELVDGRWLVDVGALKQLRAERGRWVTIKQAATALGCSPGRVERAVRDGTLQRRPGATRAVPSIPAAGLEKLRELVEAERRVEAERVRARDLARQAASEAGGRDRPPDAEHEWWTVAHAAAALGVGRNRVRQLVEQGRLPAVRRPGRIWIRRDHVLQAASARAFKAAQDVAKKRAGRGGL